MKKFSSIMDWETLKIGPEAMLTPKEQADAENRSDEPIDDI